MKPGRLSLILRIIASAALLGMLAGRLDWASLGRHISALDLRWLAPAVLLSPLCVILLAVRWNLFLRARGLRPPFGSLLRLLWTGQFLNTFLPGAVGGDIYKAVVVGRLLPHSIWEAGSTVVLDRFCALVALVLLAAVGFGWHGAWLHKVAGDTVSLPSWLGPVLLFGICAVVAAGLWLRGIEQSRVSWARRVGEVIRAVAGGMRDWRTFGGALILSLVIHLTNFGIFFVLGRALGLELAFGQVLLVMPAVLLAAMLPISINGHGVRELILVSYFSWQHVALPGGADPATAAVAVSLLFVANDLLWNLPGGLWLAWGKPDHPPS